MTDVWLPLFPLNTVLFPDGVLPLRVFEARYIDMVRACMKSASPFGVVLIKSGMEVGAAAEPETVGTIAHITKWDMEHLGLLLLGTRGGERFRILERRVLPDQRIEGRIEMLPAFPTNPAGTVDGKHLGCAQALRIVIEDIKRRIEQNMQPDTQFEDVFPQPFKLDDAGWVANRWCEILPISLKARQKLLELDDDRSRLSIVYDYLKQHGIV